MSTQSSQTREAVAVLPVFACPVQGVQERWTEADELYQGTET